MPAESRRGGIRAGAGRPPLSTEGNRVHVTIRLDPVTHAWLIGTTKPGESLGQTIDRIITRAMSRDDPTEYE